MLCMSFFLYGTFRSMSNISFARPKAPLTYQQATNQSRFSSMMNASYVYKGNIRERYMTAFHLFVNIKLSWLWILAYIQSSLRKK